MIKNKTPKTSLSSPCQHPVLEDVQRADGESCPPCSIPRDIVWGFCWPHTSGKHPPKQNSTSAAAKPVSLCAKPPFVIKGKVLMLCSQRSLQACFSCQGLEKDVQVEKLVGGNLRTLIWRELPGEAVLSLVLPRKSSSWWQA